MPLPLVLFATLLLACGDDATTGDSATIPVDDTATTDSAGETATETGGPTDSDTDTDSSCPETAWYVDADEDGYGNARYELWACEAPEGTVDNADDCDDLDPETYPDAPEACDGEDDDCDTRVDEGAEGADATWYLDNDADGYGSAFYELLACEQPEGSVDNAGDCDDLDPAVNPDALEVCDGADNDCDGESDGPDTADATVWYIDYDSDGFGSTAYSQTACDAPDGYVADDSDCDDTDSETWPGAWELCDGADDDCDSTVDEDALDKDLWYADGDGDGYGDPASAIQACDAPTGHVADATDCDDGDSSAHPGGLELCGGGDEDCDGDTDEAGASDAATWYADVDGDGYGSADYTTAACEQPTGWVSDDTDCDDTEAAAHPDIDELCDGVDNDCDGDTDEAGALDPSTWYADDDSDGYGDPDDTTESCDVPSGYTADAQDCDDTDSTISPDGEEVCDSLDNNCDGSADEDTATDANTWYRDDDEDTWGDDDDVLTSCSQPSGYEGVGGDCDDDDGDAYPGNIAGCDDRDLDCDGSIDSDADGDGASDATCGGSDCDDSDSSTVDCVSVAGSTAESAGRDCADLLATDSTLLDGLYWIDPDADGDTSDAFQVLCDMTLDGGGWTIVYTVDAEHFDGTYANDLDHTSSPPLSVNAQEDLWNAEDELSITETMFACTTQGDANTYHWSFNTSSPFSWYADTSTSHEYQDIASDRTSGSDQSTCMSTHKGDTSYGFFTVEASGCGSCANILWGNYHYTSGGDCNSTDNSYGQHTSPWDSRSIGYPVCNYQQTSDGRFWLGVR
jgi:hypothetical protein